MYVELSIYVILYVNIVIILTQYIIYMLCAAVRWSDIAGLEFAKKSVQEIVVWPMKRPDVFKGLRAAPKGILLFGPRMYPLYIYIYIYILHSN